MRLPAIIFLLTSLLPAVTVFPSHGGTSWYGSSTVFVGPYTWSAEIEPLAVSSTDAGRTTRPDYIITGCVGDTFTTSNFIYEWGGLPANTEIKFLTTSINTAKVRNKGTLPSNLIGWDTDRYKAYYIHSWGTDAAKQTFKVSESIGGPPITCATSGSGTWGLSFAGYLQAFAPHANGGAALFNYTSDGVFSRADGQPHGMGSANILVESVTPYAELPMATYIDQRTAGGAPRGPMWRYQTGFQQYCPTMVTSMTLRLRYFSSICSIPVYSIVVDQAGVATITSGLYSTVIAIGKSVEIWGFTGAGAGLNGIYPVSGIIDLTVSQSTRSIYQVQTTGVPAGTYSNPGTFILNPPALTELTGGEGQVYLYVRGTDVYISNMRGHKPGTTMVCRGSDRVDGLPTRHVAPGMCYVQAVAQTGLMFFKVPAISAPGPFTLSIDTYEIVASVRVNANSHSYPMNAVTLTSVSKKGPSSYPPFLEGYSVGTPGATFSSEKTWLSVRTNDTVGRGGGADVDSSTKPRCGNREDPESPLAYFRPASPQKSATGGATSATITHNFGTTEGLTLGQTYSSLGMTLPEGTGIHVRCIQQSPGRAVPFKVTALSPNAVTVTYDSKFSGARCDANLKQTMTAAQLPMRYNPGFSDTGSTEVWFYTGRNFFDTAIDTGDPTWANCGIHIAKAWRNRFLLGTYPNSYLLTDGEVTAAAYGWTRDPTLRVAMKKALTGAPYWDGRIDENQQRNHAFAMTRRRVYEKVTGIEDYMLQYYVEAALMMVFNNAAERPERVYNQPFLLTLNMKDIIDSYSRSSDERIPVIVKMLIDRTWTDWYRPAGPWPEGAVDPATGLTRYDDYQVAYNGNAFGERCGGSNCLGNEANWTESQLIAEMVPPFAWYWRLTGDETVYPDGTTVRSRGDELFSRIYYHGRPYWAKTYSQTMWWTRDYVQWRLGLKTAQ